MYVCRDETRTLRQYYVIHSYSEKSVHAVRMRSSSNRIMDNILIELASFARSSILSVNGLVLRAHDLYNTYDLCPIFDS